MPPDARTAVAPGRRQRCYRDQSQNPLNEDAGSRALARPAGLRASFTAAARALQSSCRSSRQKESLLALRAFFGGGESASPSLAPARAAPATSALAGASGRELQSSVRSSRQKESLPVSLRRELALRTVFGGDGSTRLSLAPVRVTAFSGVAPGTSALAGAAGRVLQSSVRSPRQKESLSMSSRRELAVRTVFCTFFFGGDELATASLPPGRTPAFSGAAAGTSLPAGTAFEACVDSGVSAGGEAAAGASLRPKGSRAIAGLSTAFRIRTMRGWGAMADAGADVSLDWAGTSADACGRGAVPADLSGLTARASALGPLPRSIACEAAS